MSLSHETFQSLFPAEAFARLDERDDAAFYARERMVAHLDATALATIEELIETLVVEERPAVLDLMASWDSHLPEGLEPREVVGLGLNEPELARNAALDRYVIHDLNRDPCLPFDDDTFDVVLNTVSVDYMTCPIEVFAEVGRILKPGGLFLVTFSNRMFPEKAVRIWRQSSEEERLMLVEDFFDHAEAFDPARVFVSKGRPRPADDKYSDRGIPSDPVYAVYAEKRGGPEHSRPIPESYRGTPEPMDKDELRRREKDVPRTMRCPHCDQKLKKWAVPNNPFIEWNSEFLYICFNDVCPYLLRGWDTLASQGVYGFSYRLMYNPESGGVGALPVYSLAAMKEGIVEDDEE